jgi:thiamine-monophosphate kinase
MAQDEFAIIRQYFRDVGPVCADTRLGIGDDAAVVEVPAGMQLVVCMDTLISGVHFPAQTAAADIAAKALAVNLSDLAAMAATPSWFLLSASLPEFDADWLRQFAEGLRQSAEHYGVQLIGGDTCRGYLSITIQVAGLVPADGYVTRAGARAGDLVLVSGQLGNAGLGLAHLQGRLELPGDLASRCLQALNRPQPRLDLVDFLRDFASAAIDISDGLQGDLGHVLKASGCGARIEQAALPVDPWIEQHDLYHYALAAGDDYQICCTLAPRHRGEVDNWNRRHPERSLTIIGEMVDSGFLLRAGDEWVDLGNHGGYRHFE